MNEEKKKNILIICLMAIIVLLIGILCYVLFIKDKPKGPGNDPKNNPENKPEEIVLKGLTKEDTSGYSNSIEVYYSKNLSEFCMFDEIEECSKEKEIIKTESSDAKKYTEYKNVYVFYKDNGKYKLYDNRSKKSYVINIGVDYTGYEFLVDSVTLDFVGVTFQKTSDSFYSFYSPEKDEILYENKFRDLYGINKDYLGAREYNCKKSNKKFVDYDTCNQTNAKVLSTHEEKELKSKNVSKGSEEYLFDALYNDKGLYFTYGNYLDGYAYSAVYTESFNKILTKTGEYDTSIGTDGNLYSNSKGIVTVFDKDGNKIKTSKKFSNVKQVIGEYIVIVKDNNLVITTVDGEETVITSWSKKKTYHSALSGWYTENGKYGIYLVVANKSVTKDEVWNYCKEHNNCNDEIMKKEDLDDTELAYEYYFIPETKEVGKIPSYVGGYAKPVLYLYPEKETKVTVTFDNESNLTTTYPKYESSWVVTAKPNGDLYDVNNKYYYALYWEEKANHEVSFDEGFYVTKDNAINFLEEKLSYIGLNDKERNEFIMYWLPILENNEKNLIYFELTDERDKYSKINISPKPDSMLRIAMHVKKVNNKVNIKEQKLTKFNRTGFAVVEWGGVNYE